MNLEDFPFDYICNEDEISIEKLIPRVVRYLYNEGWENESDLVVFTQIMKVYLTLGIVKESILNNFVHIYKCKDDSLRVEWKNVLNEYDCLCFDYWGNQLGAG